MPILLAAPPAPALTSPFSVDDETIKITIQSDKKKEKEKKKRAHKHDDKKDEKDEKDDDDCECDRPKVTLLTGTYDPRLASYGTLRQYTLSSQGAFLDYFKGEGVTKAEVIGVGMNGGALVEHRQKAPVSPFLNWGWGIYHARGSSSETKLAWRLGMGITTQVGFVAKLQLLDTKLKNGDLRGSSLMFGWRF